ncbi:glycoside hydrolase family 27 protein [Crucibulum laeve]|uniref:alpha-galactosidase n=1 Tax=Crucibulum laeve TaxID=68775 RepID=A0A5C3LYF6_9AGAR|nr:glycoside hydrolase family 27 protein [Crucibulum laeve]
MSASSDRHSPALAFHSKSPVINGKIYGEHHVSSSRHCTFPTFRIVFVLIPFSLLMTLFTLGFATFLASVTFIRKATPAIALDSGVGKLPFMGYNTWNAYHSSDKERFPSGMNNLTDLIHELGLKAGIYSDSGWFTCQLYPGSFQNEDRDVKLFQDWGFDLLKYDNCAVPFDEVIKEGMVGKYTRMANAIERLSKASGKPPLLFSLCQWGRTTDDIGPDWDALSSIINQNSFISWASDFYGHNDMDILEVGNGDLTFEEAKSHFTAWALMKSPLLISTDASLSKVTNQTLEILKNTEIIGINQDPIIGTGITPFRWGINPDWSNNYTHPAQYWSGESENGTVFMLLNVLNEPADLSFTLTESPWIRAGRQYAVRDLWSHTDNGTAVRNMTIHNVPTHGVIALLLSDAGDEPSGTQPPCARSEWCMDQNGTRIDQ